MDSVEQTKSSGAPAASEGSGDSEFQFWVIEGPDRWARIKARLEFFPRLVSAVVSQLCSSNPRRFYGIRLHGTGIRCRGVRRPVIGFYTTQMSLARSEADAIDVARRVVMDRWQSDPMYVTWNEGEPPRLEVDRTFRPLFWTAVFFIGTGHTFYAEDAETSTSGL